MPKRERLRRQAALAEKRKKQGQEEQQPDRRRRRKKNAGNDPVMEEEASSSLWRSPSVELMITIDNDDVPSIDRCFTTDSPEFTAWLLTMREAVMGGDE